MSADSGIRMDEWLAELAKLDKKSAEGFTTKEVAAQSGKSVMWARGEMAKALSAGLLEVAGSRASVRMDGRPCAVTVYRVTKPWPKKKGAKKP